MIPITITEALLGEHGVIYPQLAHLEQVAFDSPAGVRVQAALLAAGLATHAQTEDDLLFVPLEEHLGPNGGPLAVMRMEHEQVEGTLAELQQIDDVGEAKALAARLASIAREHFAKEEQVLFPMAQQVLGEDRLHQLGEEWVRRRIGG